MIETQKKDGWYDNLIRFFILIVLANLLTGWNGPTQRPAYQPVSQKVTKLIRKHGTAVIEQNGNAYIEREGKTIRVF